MDFWPIIPGLILVLASISFTFIAMTMARRSHGIWALRAIRLRFLGIALVFLLMGIESLAVGVFAGLDAGRIAIGVVLLGFAALWLYARGGIGPTFPAD